MERRDRDGWLRTKNKIVFSWVMLAETPNTESQQRAQEAAGPSSLGRKGGSRCGGLGLPRALEAAQPPKGPSSGAGAPGKVRRPAPGGPGTENSLERTLPLRTAKSWRLKADAEASASAQRPSRPPEAAHLGGPRARPHVTGPAAEGVGLGAGPCLRRRWSGGAPASWEGPLLQTWDEKYMSWN